MPVHDWTTVDAGTFHHFHGSWITHLCEALNGGLLPRGFYSMSEQHATLRIADILTLHAGERTSAEPRDSGGVAVAEPPPRVSRKMELQPSAAYRRARRTIAIRHATGHRVVALLEIVSPGNKDRQASVEEFVSKAVEAVDAGVHLLVVDLHPPGLHDPNGMHGAIWSGLGSDDFEVPPGKPLTLAAYEACKLPRAWVESIAVGDPLPDMPLFLDIGRHVSVPLERTYQEAYRGVPEFWREVIEGRRSASA
jgi:hypothetical protein